MLSLVIEAIVQNVYLSNHSCVYTFKIIFIIDYSATNVELFVFSD